MDRVTLWPKVRNAISKAVRSALNLRRGAASGHNLGNAFAAFGKQARKCENARP